MRYRPIFKSFLIVFLFFAVPVSSVLAAGLNPKSIPDAQTFQANPSPEEASYDTIPSPEELFYDKEGHAIKKGEAVLLVKNGRRTIWFFEGISRSPKNPDLITLSLIDNMGTETDIQYSVGNCPNLYKDLSDSPYELHHPIRVGSKVRFRDQDKIKEGTVVIIFSGGYLSVQSGWYGTEIISIDQIPDFIIRPDSYSIQ